MEWILYLRDFVVSPVYRHFGKKSEGWKVWKFEGLKVWKWEGFSNLTVIQRICWKFWRWSECLQVTKTFPPSWSEVWEVYPLKLCTVVHHIVPADQRPAWPKWWWRWWWCYDDEDDDDVKIGELWGRKVCKCRLTWFALKTWQIWYFPRESTSYNGRRPFYYYYDDDDDDGGLNKMGSHIGPIHLKLWWTKLGLGWSQIWI